MTVGFYAGSFDPPTLGHLDIIARGAAVCDRLVVGVGSNPNKKPYLDMDVRLKLLSDECKGMGLDSVTVVSFSGATVDFARENGIDTLIRGLRNSGDLERERGLSEVNRTNGFDTLFFLARSSHTHLSSALVREVIAAGLSLDELVSDRVAAALVTAGRIPKRPATGKLPTRGGHGV